MPWDDVPLEILHEFASECQELLERLSVDVVELETSPSEELISSVFRSFHTIKGSAGFLGFTQVESQAHDGESLLAQVRAGEVTVSADLVSSLLGFVDRLSVEVTSAVASAQRAAAVTSDALDAAAAPSLAASSVGNRSSAQSSLSEDSAPEDAQAHTAGPGDTATVRVRLDALDGLLAASGELVIARNKVHTEAVLQGGVLSDSLPLLDRAVRDVQAQAVRARLQPLSVLLSKLPRTVRDAARELGKSARVELHGANTEVDRSLIDALRDPLVHLVRNSVDHGLEDAPTRVASGKPEIGTVSVTAWQSSGSAHVSVSDDGAGISWDLVRARAVELGLFSASDAPSETALGEVLFSPGFSTASAVSRISGRGVGLDVVHRALADVGGSVSIASAAGHGTTVTMTVPLSLLVMPALLVLVNSQVLALDQHFVEEVVEVDHKSLTQVAGSPAVVVRGEPVFVSPLASQASSETSGLVDIDGKFAVVVASAGGTRGVLVDDVLGVEDVTVRPLDPMLRLERSYSGAALLEDGSVVFVVDSALFKFTAAHDGRGRRGRKPASIVQEPEYFLKASLGSEAVAFAACEVARLETFTVTDLPKPQSTGSIAYGQGALPIINWGSGAFSSPTAETVVLRLPDGGLVGVVTDFCEDVIAATRAQDLSGSFLPDLVIPVQGERQPLRLVSLAEVQGAFDA